MSGRVLVRMPPALHEALAARAAEQKVSTNYLIVALLAGAISFTLDESAALNRKAGHGEGD